MKYLTPEDLPRIQEIASAENGQRDYVKLLSEPVSVCIRHCNIKTAQSVCLLSDVLMPHISGGISV